ncbi:MAG: hypothetical protein V1835_00200 [Candidatus Micrarchaeota archaeon]
MFDDPASKEYLLLEKLLFIAIFILLVPAFIYGAGLKVLGNIYTFYLAIIAWLLMDLTLIIRGLVFIRASKRKKALFSTGVLWFAAGAVGLIIMIWLYPALEAYAK